MSIIRKLNRKTITLPSLTRAAREAGDLTEDQQIEAVIRRVRASEVVGITGIPPQLHRAALDRQPGETPEQQRERLRESIMSDTDLVNASMRQTDLQRRAIVHLGTIHVKEPDGTTYSVTLDDTNEEGVTPSELGDDFATLHDAIVTLSSLDYPLLSAAGEEAGTTAFPEEQVADRPVEDGGTVRDDASEAPS